MPEQSLHTIMRHSPAGVVTLLGPELRYGFVNEAMQGILGGPVPVGEPLATHPGPLPADSREVMQQVYQSGRPYVAKAYRLLPAARAPARYFDVALEPVREEDGCVNGLLLFAVDITDQKQTRQRSHELAIETQRLDTRLRVLTETVPQITYPEDATGRIEYVSPQRYYFTGQPTTVDQNAIWPLLIHPDDRLRVLYQAETARATGTG